MTKNEIIEKVNKYNNSENELNIVSFEIEDTLVDDELNSTVLVKINLSNGQIERLVWTDKKYWAPYLVDINGKKAYYMGNCYSYYGNPLIGCDWPEFYDFENDDYIDPEDLTDEEKKEQLQLNLEGAVDWLDDYFEEYFNDEFKETEVWHDIVEEYVESSNEEIIDYINNKDKDEHYFIDTETDMCLTDDDYMYDGDLLDKKNINENDFIKVKRVKYYDIYSDSMVYGYKSVEEYDIAA